MVSKRSGKICYRTNIYLPVINFHRIDPSDNIGTLWCSLEWGTSYRIIHIGIARYMNTKLKIWWLALVYTKSQRLGTLLLSIRSLRSSADLWNQKLVRVLPPLAPQVGHVNPAKLSCVGFLLFVLLSRRPLDAQCDCRRGVCRFLNAIRRE